MSFDVPLAIDDLRHRRAGSRLGAQIRYFDTIESTNTFARHLAHEGAPEGTVVISETQTQGRGRLGRTWVSPPFRNLYLSVILRPSLAPQSTPCLALVVGLATAEAVAESVPRAVLKWPNDVLVDGRKVAGVLTEMEAADGRVQCVIAGIGVNLNMDPTDFPAELQDKAAGLRGVTGATVDRVAFAHRLLSRLEERYQLFLRSGFAAIRPLWEGLSGFQGRRVQIDDAGQPYTGVILGLADDGTLRLQGADGKEIRVVAGDVSVVDGYR